MKTLYLATSILMFLSSLIYAFTQLEPYRIQVVIMCLFIALTLKDQYKKEKAGK